MHARRSASATSTQFMAVFEAAFPFLLDGLQDFLNVILVWDDSDMISDLKRCPYFLLLLEVSFISVTSSLMP